MKGLKTLTKAVAALALATGLSAPAFAQAADPDAYGDGYQSGAYGRVRAADEGATILRAEGEQSQDSDQVTVNAPIFPGDRLRTDDRQRAEVQLAGGTIVRIDRGGELVFQSMPNPSASYQDNTVLALNSGAIRVVSHAGDKEDNDQFRIDTPDASIYLLGDGEFRIEIDDRSGTRIASLRGVAEVVGNDSSVLVRGGMQTLVDAGASPQGPRSYTAYASDGFDRWCDARDDAYRVHDRNADVDYDREELPEEVEPYYGELSSTGDFVDDPEYGTVWYPRGVATGWRPYYDGYWNYGPSGYFWVSSEPWGWAPYHYGNWQWTLRGWGWVPGPVFAGAWVSWSWGSAYVGWAPLDYWGRPGWVGGPLYSGYYDPGCWTFVGYNRFADRQINRYAVPISAVRDDLRHATVVSRAPSIEPRRIAQSPQWRDRALRQVMDDRAAQMRPIETDRRPQQRMSDVQTHLMRRPQQQSPSARLTPRDGSNGPADRRVTAPRARRILEDPRPHTRNDVRDLYERMSRPRETRGQDDAAPRTQQMRDPQRTQPRNDPRAGNPRNDPRVDPRRSPQERVQDPSQRRFDQPRVQQPQPRRYEQPRTQQPEPRAQQPQPRRYEQPRAQQPQPRRYEQPRAQQPQRSEPPRYREAPRRSEPPQYQQPRRAEAPRAQAPRSQPQPRGESSRRQAPKQQSAPKERPKQDRHH